MDAEAIVTHVYFCPQCGCRMDVQIQPIEYAHIKREIVMVTCWQEGQCQLATFTLSDATLLDFDDLRKRYKAEINFCPKTGERYEQE